MAQQQKKKPKRIVAENRLNKLGFKTLKILHRASFNVYIRPEMKAVMNADEIFAKYFFAGMAAIHPKLLGGMDPNEFYSAIRHSDDYSYSELNGEINKWPRRFDANLGDQLKRLEDLSQETREVYLNSLLAAPRLSSYESPLAENTYQDINATLKYRHIYLEFAFSLFPLK